MNKIKLVIINFFHHFHMVHVLFRLHQGKQNVLADKPDWVVQMIDHNVTVKEIKEEYPDDEYAVNLCCTLINITKKELIKRNLTSFYVL